MAYRDCTHCRAYHYDEKTGKPREGRDGKLLKRVIPPPCERDGCAKGHWRDPIEIKREHQPLLALHASCRATGGACLTEAERADPLCAYALGRIDETVRAVEQASMSKALGNAVASIAAIASTGK